MVNFNGHQECCQRACTIMSPYSPEKISEDMLLLPLYVSMVIYWTVIILYFFSSLILIFFFFAFMVLIKKHIIFSSSCLNIFPGITFVLRVWKVSMLLLNLQVWAFLKGGSFLLFPSEVALNFLPCFHMCWSGSLNTHKNCFFFFLFGESQQHWEGDLTIECCQTEICLPVKYAFKKKKKDCKVHKTIFV